MNYVCSTDSSNRFSASTSRDTKDRFGSSDRTLNHRTTQAYASDSSSNHETEHSNRGHQPQRQSHLSSFQWTVPTPNVTSTFEPDSSFAFTCPTESDPTWSPSCGGAGGVAVCNDGPAYDHSDHFNCVAAADASPTESSNVGNKIKNRNNNRSASILLRSKALLLSDSDSESESANFTTRSDCTPIKSKSSNRKPRLKAKRKKLDTECQAYLYAPVNSNQCFGKRKRSNTISFHHDEPLPADRLMMLTDRTDYLSNQRHNHQEQNRFDSNQMECDDPSSETQLSDWSDQETKFEADDEQSDFFEASLTNLNIRQKKSGGSGSGLANRTMMLRTNPTNMNGFARTNGSASGSTCSRNPFIANTSNSHHHHLHHAPSHASCSTSGMSTAVWKKRRKNLENKLYS